MNEERKEMYGLLKKCHENDIPFYWGRDGGCAELNDVCFAYEGDDSSKLESLIRDNCSYSFEVCRIRSRKYGGAVRLNTGISERAFHSIFDEVIDVVIAERVDRTGYRYLLVPLRDAHEGELSPLEDDDVLEILSSGYTIKHTNIHYDSRGVLSMSIIFELSSKPTPADVLLAFGNKTPWGSDT